MSVVGLLRGSAMHSVAGEITRLTDFYLRMYHHTTLDESERSPRATSLHRSGACNMQCHWRKAFSNIARFQENPK